jgi:outer membrane immunogenic protein
MTKTPKMRTLTQACLGACAIGALAQAAPALADPAADPGFTWTGPYVGATVGYTSGNTKVSAPGDEFGGYSSDVIHKHGTTWGGDIGYNYQLTPHVVIGGEVNLHGTSQKAGNTYVGGEGYTGATAIGVHNHFGGDVSARFGLTANQVLVFGKVGYSFAKYDYYATSYNDVDYSASKTQSGVLLGVGIEYALTHHWSIKGEFDHTTFAHSTVTLTGTDSSTIAASIGEIANTAKFGVNYRF